MTTNTNERIARALGVEPKRIRIITNNGGETALLLASHRVSRAEVEAYYHENKDGYLAGYELSEWIQWPDYEHDPAASDGLIDEMERRHWFLITLMESAHAHHQLIGFYRRTSRPPMSTHRYKLGNSASRRAAIAAAALEALE